MSVQQFVREHLDQKTIVAIIDSYEQFLRDGYIGDEPVRVYAEKYLRDTGFSIPIVTTMERVAFECYRQIALLSLKRKEYTDG